MTDETTSIVPACSSTIIGMVATCLVWKFRNNSSEEIDDNDTSHHKKKREQPFRNYNHPEKTVIDKIISSVIPFFLPVADLAQHPSHNKSENHGMRKTIASLRAKLSTMEEPPFQTSCKEWNSLIQKHKQKSDDILISGTVTIPRNDQVLLSLFGLVPTHPTAPPQDNGPELFVDLTCPASAIQSGIELELKPGSDEDAKKLKDHGFRRFKPCRMEDVVFHESSQLLLWFHGGGLVLGNARTDNQSIVAAIKLSKKLLERTGGSTCSTPSTRTAKEENCSPSPLAPPPIVVLSVNYRLAPENPFPAAVIDGLSASSFLIKRHPSLNLHIGGISAGGNLSAVVGLETYRAFGGVTSIMVHVPMTQPRADSLSYHLNSKSSGACPVEFLRWCWSAYLQLDEKQDGSIDFYVEGAMQKALDSSVWSDLYNSNSRDDDDNDDNDDDNYNGAMFWRLICPQVDLPSLEDDRVPKILIATATADPLHDDGVELVDGLKNKCKESSGKIHHFDLKGSHVLSSVFDTKGKDAFILEWSKSF